MPHNDQINYNVKVRLDPDDQSSDQAVVWNNTSKKFELGTGTGITITNPSDNNILTADGTTSNIIGESYLRWVDGTGTGQANGTLIVGNNVTELAQGYQMLNVGSSDISSGFPNLIVHTTNSSTDNPYIRFGLQNGNVAAIGFGAKDDASNKKFQIGTYNSETSTVFAPYWSMNHSGRIGMIDNPTSYPSSVLGKSWVDSNYQLLVNRSSVNNPQETGNTSVVGIQNYASNVTPDVKVLQLYVGAQNVNLQNTGNSEPNPRYIEFYTRNSNNTTDFLVGYIGPWREGGSWGVEMINASDKRLKKDISPLSVGLKELLKIQPVEYKWKVDNSLDKGFIAQDLYEVYPEAVQKPLTNDFKKNPWAVAPNRLIPLLVKSIQDQQEIIEDLKIRINKLENNKL